jgi:mevalonate kinase
MTQALAALATSGHVLLSCPQKVCISGDYGDMFGTCTLTCAISARPQVEIERKRGVGKPEIVLLLGSKIHDDWDRQEWRLLAAAERLLPKAAGVRITVRPSDLREQGLGSSGAGSLLLAAAIAIVDGRPLALEQLVREAHKLESEVAGCPCGPQDHASAAWGGLRLFDYGEAKLASEVVRHDSLLRRLSFWTFGAGRRAREIIPHVQMRHTDSDIDEKTQITKRMAKAIGRREWKTVNEELKRECANPAPT